jgi:TRAP-type C4-dicarboxylate transport system permease small subunit
MSETGKSSTEDQWRGGSQFTTNVHKISGGLSGILLFFLMAVTIVDVAGRYLFNAPLPGGNEIVQLVMAAIIYSALPSVNRQEGHITVDLLDFITPKQVVRIRQILVNLVAVVVLGTITWCLWLLADDLRLNGETWEYLNWKRSPIVYFMFLCSGIGTIIFILNLLRYVRGARRPEPGFI